MTISNQYLPQTFLLKFGDVTLQETDSHKHLGLSLLFKTIANGICISKLSYPNVIFLIGRLHSLKYRFSPKSLEIMYKSFILPHFDFSDVVWDNCIQKLADDLEKIGLDSDALRIIIGTARHISHDKLYDESGFTPVKERRRRHKIILHFKLVTGMVPLYLIDRLPQLVSFVNPYHRNIR